VSDDLVHTRYILDGAEDVIRQLRARLVAVEAERDNRAWDEECIRADAERERDEWRQRAERAEKERDTAIALGRFAEQERDKCERALREGE
jgi:hypothetical protein